MGLGVFLPLQFSERVWAVYVLALLYTFGRIHLWSHLTLGFCFFLETFFFYYSVDFCAWNWSVHIFYFFLVQFWKVLLLRICLFLLDCPFYWHRVAHSNLLRTFVLSAVSSFSFLILIEFPPPFIFWCFWWFVNFIFSENHLLALLVFAIVSFISFSFVSALLLRFIYFY